MKLHTILRPDFELTNHSPARGKNCVVLRHRSTANRVTPHKFTLCDFKRCRQIIDEVKLESSEVRNRRAGK